MILDNIFNMVSDKGNAVPNQVITVGNYKHEYNFYSYGTFISGIDHMTNSILIGKDYNYSRTTAKYRNKFFNKYGLNELASTQGIEKALKDGYIEYLGERYTVELY